MNIFKFLQQIPTTLKHLFVISILSSALAQTASAATLDDVVLSINQFHRYVESVVNDTKTAILQKMYEPNPSMPATIVGNQGQEIAKANLTNKTYGFALDQIKESLSNRTNSQASALSRIPASDTIITKSNISLFSNEAAQAPNLAAGDANFDFETFFGTSAYTPQREAQAKNFFLLASGTYQPITDFTIEGLTPDEITKLQNNAIYRTFQLALRSYVTNQSVGLDNLFHLLAERIVQPNLGKQAGLYNSNGQPINDASPLQVREYLATRRTTSPRWYEDMAKASPATVSRESLFVLAEMRQELFNLQQQNDRLLATMSLLGVQLSASGKSNLQRLQQETQAEINRIKGIPPATPTTPEGVTLPNQ
ncbi:MAG: hypothetical protein WBE18_03780 [Gammaproteobacteria bacterium]